MGPVVTNLAVLVRRLCDVNKSRWFILLGLIPLAGLVVLVFTLMQPNPADQRFDRSVGPPPHGG